MTPDASGVVWRRRALLLVVAVTVVRLVLNGLTGLGDSEAYYWAWAKHPSLSYFDHPPAIAAVIRATTAIFGDNPFAVRLGPTILFDLAVLFIFLVAERVAGSRAGFLAVALTLITPAFGLAGGTAVPDVPLAAAWCAALYVIVRIAEGDDRRLWLVFGALVGLGFLSKYIALLLVIPAAAVILGTHGRRSLRTPWPYLAALIAAGVALPVVLWNIDTGWATLRYHASRHAAGGPSFANLGRLVGGQLLYVSPFVLAAAFAVALPLTRSLHAGGNWRERVLWLASVPVLLMLYGFVLWTPKAEPHWPIIGYVPLIVVAAARYDRWRARFATHGWYRWFRRLLWGFPAVTLALAYLHILTPALVAVFPEGAYQAKWDLANELRDWPVAADRAIAIAAGQRDAFVTSYHYTMCGQIEFAIKGRAPFACLSERVDAFAYWARDREWIGRTAVFVTDWRYGRPVDEILKCDRTELLPAIETTRGGKKAREFRFALCHGFRGRIKPLVVPEVRG